MKTGTKIAIAVVALVVLGAAFTDTEETEDLNLSEVFEEKPKVEIEQGQVLATEYFDVVVNESGLYSKLSTGNPYTDVVAEEGMGFIVINVTFKNTDTESRSLFEGDLQLITPEGKEYLFDKTETVLADGWFELFEQINPLTSITANIAYGVPADIKGKLYYHPSRSESDQVIFLGEL